MLEGIIRDSIGKKATKALRRDGYLIANIYGKGIENINAAFKKNEFIKAVRNKEKLLLDIKVNDKELSVAVVEYQKDPITNDLLHVDLKVAVNGVVSNFMISVKTVGLAKGIKDRGVLMLSKKRLKVQCTPENIPNSFDLDVTNLGVGASILVRDIKVPENVRMMEADRIAVVGVIKAK
jgi:large subunit ribosomal protein L25